MRLLPSMKVTGRIARIGSGEFNGATIFTLVLTEREDMDVFVGYMWPISLLSLARVGDNIEMSVEQEERQPQPGITYWKIVDFDSATIRQARRC